MTIKIAFAGGMTSGKSTIARLTADRFGNAQLISFAGPVKAFASEVCKAEGKDRHLLQEIGTHFRKLNEDLWVGILLSRLRSDVAIIVVDDVRYANELRALKKRGFVLVWLHTEEETRIQRLTDVYGLDSSQHIAAMQHESEMQTGIKEECDLQYNTSQMSATSIASSISSWAVLETSSWSSAASSSPGISSAKAIDD